MKRLIRASTSEEDFEKYEDEIKEIDQEFTSENTSINFKKVPAIFKLVGNWTPGTVNIDYGGGRADTAADYLTQYNVINLVYDPYNRSSEHNSQVIQTVRKAGGADTATCSNVLNVIKEQDVRLNVLKNMSKLVKPGGKIYITVYEGKGNSEEGPTKSGYQLNRKTADYLDEIQQVFPNATRKGKLIVCVNDGSVKASSFRKTKVNSSREVKVYPEDKNVYYEGYHGESDATLYDLKTYWNDCKDSDPSIKNYKSFDAWLDESISNGYFKIVESSNKCYKKVVKASSYRVGDCIEYDSNWRGVTPKIGHGKIVKIESGLAGHGDYQPSRILTIEDEDGNRFKLDEGAVINLCDSLSVTSSEDSKYMEMMRNHKYNKKFSSRDAGELKDLTSWLKGSGYEWEQYDNITDNGCTVFYDNQPDFLKASTCVTSATDEQARISEEIREQVKEKVSEYMRSEGFPDAEISQYTRVDAEFRNNMLCINVGVEVSYEGLLDLSEILDPLVQSYDSESYFEAVDPGIIEAWLRLSEIVKKDVKGSWYDIPEPNLDPPEDTSEELEPFCETIELGIDSIIYIDQDGQIKFKNENWAYGDGRQGCWSSEEYPSIDLEYDAGWMIDRVITILDEKELIPYEEGTYWLKCNIEITYEISGVFYDSKYYGNDEDGDPVVENEYYTDGAEVDVVESKVSDFSLESVE